MRIHSFTAPSMNQAMRAVRERLGDDAIILSSQQKNGKVEVTAAIDEIAEVGVGDTSGPGLPDWETNWSNDWAEPAGVTAPLVNGAAEPAAEKTDPATRKLIDDLVAVLAFHGIPSRLGERLGRLALAAGADEATIALAAAFDERFRFKPLQLPARRPILFVGPSGSGKTLTLAKIATQMALAGTAPEIVTTDVSRPGAMAQLAGFTRILDLPLSKADGPEALAERIAGASAPLLIDSAGVDPYSPDQMTATARLAVAADAEIVLVLAAGFDPEEMADQAQAFAKIGASRLIVTRADASRRLGGIVCAAAGSGLALSHICHAPSAAHGLSTLNPVKLARLLIRDPLQPLQFTDLSEAAR
ncbi:hypothetical protein [Oceanibacterium hippocampi]|uniref:Flagellar biosynthesis protein FlhF n=1 Tax=Oceanibacterium hippocampi TaxID=745714 RepID=A0A1Y5TQA0_9PROT|nr:hypothetical protein [Oceanibacterium hippocampi]SLN69585.1 Flagellar biosynthesis protein FlhF [Oceanibacterium hippocampi]